MELLTYHKYLLGLTDFACSQKKLHMVEMFREYSPSYISAQKAENKFLVV